MTSATVPPSSVEEQVARALHAVRLYGPQLADATAVVGESSLGLGAVAVLLARGVGKVWFVVNDDGLRAAAERMGAQVEGRPASSEELAALHERLGGYGADVVFECDGSSETRRLAIELARPAGRVVLVAENPEPVGMSPNLLVFEDKRVQGSRGYSREELQIARDLLEDGRLTLPRLLAAAGGAIR